MSLSKLKSLILLILALCNLCLLFVVLPTRLESKRIARRAEQNLSALYEKHALQLPDEKLPESRKLYLLEVSIDSAAAEAAVRSLLGDTMTAAEDTEGSFTSAMGDCSFHRNVLDATLCENRAVNGSLRSDAKKRFRRMGFSVDWIDGPHTDGAFRTVTIRQRIAGEAVFSCALTFSYQDGVLQSVYGNVCPIDRTITCVGSKTCISCADALIHFLDEKERLGWVGSAILSIEQGYLSADSASASVLRLIPVWQLKTDTGVYYINGITRQISSDHLSVF